MNIPNNPLFFLFIEPTGEAADPVIDSYTRKMAGAFRTASKGISPYRTETAKFLITDIGSKGFHICNCGHAASSNQDYLIGMNDPENIIKVYRGNFTNESGAIMVQGVITNSLCIHYVACHRKDIPEEVLNKILLLVGNEVEPTAQELSYELKVV